MVPNARWAGNLLTVLPLWLNRLATIVSPREFGPTLASSRTHRRTNNFPTDDANCRVAVFGSSPLQWICKEWIQKLGSDKAKACFGSEKHTELGDPTSQGEGTHSSSTGIPDPSRSHRSLLPFSRPPSSSWPSSLPLFGWSLLLYIPLFRSSSSYTCQSSMPTLKCMSHRLFFLALYELLWPPSPCPKVTSTSMELGC